MLGKGDPDNDSVRVVCVRACLSVVVPAELGVRECVRPRREHLNIAAVRRRPAWGIGVGLGGATTTHGQRERAIGFLPK